jgi:CubicO group peptidase (beta-lactamase class C family)
MQPLPHGLVGALLALAPLLAPAAAPDAALAARLDAEVIATMAAHRLPGLALVAVQDGQVVLARGWGEASANAPGRAADERTLFKIASMSKAMTALAVGLLVDDGRLAWDAPLSRWIPELQAADPEVARLTARQLLSHQARLDLDRLEPLLWPQPNAFGAADLIAGLKALARDPRPVPGFHYSNVGYALLGELIHRASGQRYGEFVTQRVFRPLGMDCVVGRIDPADRTRLAQPHAIEQGRLKVVRADPDLVDEGLDAAAGGVRCSALGMGTWLRFQLDHAAFPALRVSDATWAALHSAEVVNRTRLDGGTPVALSAYGLGLQLQAGADASWRYDHSGGLAGAVSYLSWNPAARNGFALMLNRADGPARQHLADCLRGALGDANARCTSLGPMPPEPIAEAPAELPLPPAREQQLSGRWRDPWLGEVTLCRRGGRIELRVLKSPRLVGRVVATPDGGTALLWDDASVRSDARLTLEPGGLRLSALGESDFDFTALRLRRVGRCPG